MIVLGTGIEEEQAGEDGVRKSPVQGHRLDQHVAASVGEIFQEIAGAAVAEVDRLDRYAEQQAGFFGRPSHVDLLGADTASHPAFGA